MTRLTADDFNRLYTAYARRAQGFFLRMTGYDQALAEDLTQELFTRLWEHRDAYDPAHPFATWMFSVAYNLCKNAYRHQEVVEKALDGPWHPSADYAAEDITFERQQLKEQLAAAVRRLPDEQREVFLLRYEEELSIADVARILGIPEGTVKSRAAYALKRLREQFADDK